MTFPTQSDGCHKGVQVAFVTSIIILSMCDTPGDLRKFVNVPSSMSCIEDE